MSSGGYSFTNSGNPFISPGEWFKGNLHSHSLASDGMLNISQLTHLYKANGYSFFFVTDHEKRTNVEGFSSNEFLILPGEEISVSSSTGRSMDVLALNIRDEIDFTAKETRERTLQHILHAVRHLGGEVIVCHPCWSSISANDLLDAEGYLGLEIFNTSVMFYVGQGLSVTLWNDLLMRGKKVYGFAADDVHWHFNPHRPVDACVAWIMVKAKALTPEDIVDSIRRGMFYSSTGPEIVKIDTDDRSIKAKCSPCRSITFIGDACLGERFTAPAGEVIEEAEYRFRGKETYVRVECEDPKGGLAWSNPFFTS